MSDPEKSERVVGGKRKKKLFFSENTFSSFFRSCWIMYQAGKENENFEFSLNSIVKIIWLKSDARKCLDARSIVTVASPICRSQPRRR